MDSVVVVIVMEVVISKIGRCREPSVAEAIAVRLSNWGLDWAWLWQSNGAFADNKTVIIAVTRCCSPRCSPGPVTNQILSPRQHLELITLDGSTTQTGQCVICNWSSGVGVMSVGSVDGRRTVLLLDLDIVVGLLLLDAALFLDATLLLCWRLLLGLLLLGSGDTLALLGDGSLGISTAVLASSVRRAGSSRSARGQVDSVGLQESLIALGSVGINVYG